MSKRRRAFSLVELLVVIGIIGLLLALLLPGLSRARQQAKLTQCLATLRNIGQAGALHAVEHRGYLPTAGWQWNAVDGVANPAGLDDATEKKYDYYEDDGVRRPMPITAALAVALGKTLRTDSRENLEEDLRQESLTRLFHCPSQDLQLSGWTERGDDKGAWMSPDEVSSYTFNEALLGRRIGNHLGPRGKLTGVTNGSQVFFAMDGRPRDNANDRCFLVFDFGPTDSVLDFQVKNRGTDLGQESLDFVRHRQRLNALFLDGHAETFLMDDGGLSSIKVSNGFLD